MAAASAGGVSLVLAGAKTKPNFFTSPKFIAINELTSRPAGLEPATYGLEIRCSVHLSYERKTLSFWDLITF